MWPGSFYSLKVYINSNEFAPAVEVDAAMIDEIFKR